MRLISLKRLRKFYVRRGRLLLKAFIARKAKVSRHRARRSICWAAAIVVVFHFALVIAALRNPAVRDPIYGERERAVQSRLAADRIVNAKLMMIMGTSRAGNAFHAQRMEQMLREQTGEPIVVYNFALPGEGPITQQLYLRRLLEKGVRPDLLVIEVVHLQYHDFGQPAEGLTMISDCVLPGEVDLVKRYGVRLEGYRDSWLRLCLNPYFELRNTILSRFDDGLSSADVFARWNHDSDAWGWRPIVAQQSGWKDYEANLAVARKSFEYLVHNFKPHDGAVSALHDMLDLCEKNGIKVMLVQLPESSDFRSWYSPESKFTLATLFESIADDHQVKWLDAQIWVPDGQFADGHHLLSGGATVFSERFVQEAAKPWLMSYRVNQRESWR